MPLSLSVSVLTLYASPSGTPAFSRAMARASSRLISPAGVSGAEDAGGVWPPEGAVPPGAVSPACPPQPVRQASKSAAVKPKEKICFILRAPFCVCLHPTTKNPGAQLNKGNARPLHPFLYIHLTKI